MFRRVLVPLDGSTLAEEAIGTAVTIARASRANLELMTVREPFSFTGGRDAPPLPANTDGDLLYLARLAGELRSGAGLDATSVVRHGLAAEEICAHAQATGVDLIVMTSHGRTGFHRAWLGSVADDVARRSCIPVLTLPPAAHTDTGAAVPPHISRILVPVDGSALSFDILQPAADLARTTAARIVLLHVVPPVPVLLPGMFPPLLYPPTVVDDEATARLVEQADSRLRAIARQLADEGVIAVEVRTQIHPHPVQAIVECIRSQGITAVAMSTHGRGASRLLMGSVADKVRRGGGVPVLLRRPPVDARSSRMQEADEVLAHLPPMAALA